MRYDDIINLPHHISKKHAHMSMADRAAQFSPFMALVGFDGEVSEMQRLTDKKTELSESEKEVINEKLMLLAENIREKPYAAITYFVPDGKKAGGAYVTAEGRIKRVNEYEKSVTMADRRVIIMEDIADIKLSERR